MQLWRNRDGISANVPKPVALATKASHWAKRHIRRKSSWSSFERPVLIVAVLTEMRHVKFARRPLYSRYRTSTLRLKDFLADLVRSHPVLLTSRFCLRRGGCCPRDPVSDKGEKASLFQSGNAACGRLPGLPAGTDYGREQPLKKRGGACENPTRATPEPEPQKRGSPARHIMLEDN